MVKRKRAAAFITVLALALSVVLWMLSVEAVSGRSGGGYVKDPQGRVVRATTRVVESDRRLVVLVFGTQYSLIPFLSLIWALVGSILLAILASHLGGVLIPVASKSSSDA